MKDEIDKRNISASKSEQEQEVTEKAAHEAIACARALSHKTGEISLSPFFIDKYRLLAPRFMVELSSDKILPIVLLTCLAYYFGPPAGYFYHFKSYPDPITAFFNLNGVLQGFTYALIAAVVLKWASEKYDTTDVAYWWTMRYYSPAAAIEKDLQYKKSKEASLLAQKENMELLKSSILSGASSVPAARAV